MESEAMARPTVMTDEVVRKLEEAFAMGCTDVEACLFAGISRPAFYDYCNANPKFSDRKELLRTNPTLKARKLLLMSLESGDADAKTIQWVIEKQDGKAKQAVTVEGGEKPVEMVFKWKS